MRCWAISHVCFDWHYIGLHHYNVAYHTIAFSSKYYGIMQVASTHPWKLLSSTGQPLKTYLTEMPFIALRYNQVASSWLTRWRLGITPCAAVTVTSRSSWWWCYNNDTFNPKPVHFTLEAVIRVIYVRSHDSSRLRRHRTLDLTIHCFAVGKHCIHCCRLFVLELSAVS